MQKRILLLRDSLQVNLLSEQTRGSVMRKKHSYFRFRRYLELTKVVFVILWLFIRIAKELLKY